MAEVAGIRISGVDSAKFAENFEFKRGSSIQFFKNNGIRSRSGLKHFAKQFKQKYIEVNEQ